jgi:glycosyltransferase involved in cell wall biosynthesis
LEKAGIKKSNIAVIISGLMDKPITKMPIKEKIPTFIFVSRVVKMKGIEEVTRSFFYILKEIKNANLWIIGDGDKAYVDSLKKMMKSYSIFAKVKLFGHVNNAKKLELMQRAHLLLHASVKEGWGLVVIEAASQGTPSVVYNVGGLRDSVINGKTGVVIRKNKPEEMAREAVDLLNDSKRYSFYQKDGLKRARSLEWKIAVDQSSKLIESFKK